MPSPPATNTSTLGSARKRRASSPGGGGGLLLAALGLGIAGVVVGGLLSGD